MKITRIIIYVYNCGRTVIISVRRHISHHKRGRGYLEHGMHERCNVHRNSSVIL